MSKHDDESFEEELTARAAALPKAIAPERDLWPGIERVIKAPLPPERPLWNTVWAKAAAVLLLVGGSSGVTYLAMERQVDVTSPVVTGQPLNFDTVSGSFGSAYHLGPDYTDAHRNLADALDAKLAQLPPETRDAVTANLDTIRKAITDINSALAEEPDNVLLQELLLDSYRDELTLMKKVDGITSAAMRRGDI